MNEEQELPKKIALKVPSLFIKSAPSSSTQSTPKESEAGEQKKPSRPMPASMKKKSEEAKLNKTISEQSPSGPSTKDEIKAASNSSLESTPPKKQNRPMPASARRKHEETTSNCDTNTSDSDSVTKKDDSSKRIKKPMPASARAKMLEGGRTDVKSEQNDIRAEGISENFDQQQDNIEAAVPAPSYQKIEDVKSEENVKEDEVSTTDQENVEKVEKKKMTRPMPASAKRKLEVKTEDCANVSSDKTETEETLCDEGLVKDEDKPKKKVNKPMPASARRKLEDFTEKTEIKDEDCDNKPAEIQNLDKNDVTGPKEQQEINDASENEATKETKKINISLGGIKFPTFKKPMPASAKKKAEENQIGATTEKNKDQTNGSSESEALSEIQGTEQLLRTSRRGKNLTKELVALTDENFPCEICGREFYRLKEKNGHMLTHSQTSEANTEEDVPKKTPNKSSSKSKKKKGVKESKYKGMTDCPHCNRIFKDWRKLANHIYKCSRQAKFDCSHCDKKFRDSKSLEKHLNTHKEISGDQDNDFEDAVPIPLSPLDFTNDSVSSPMSVDSKDDGSKSSSKSLVEKPKAMPKSVKVKLRKEERGQEKSPEPETPRGSSKDIKSFKRKIADVLSNLGSRKFNNESPTGDDGSDDEDFGPPRKKTILSKEDKDENESIRGHPMPASVKKKLQDRGNREMKTSAEGPGLLKKSAVTTPESASVVDEDLDTLECEVCHKVFTSMSNRRRHESTVHSIKNPRGPTKSSASSQVSNAITPTPKIEAKTSSPQLDLTTLPNRGKCPICSKYISSHLRKHVRNVHKVNNPGNSTSSANPTATKTKISPVVRPSAPKTYKIYKTATNKLKQKLASSVSNNKPVISLEKMVPLTKVAENIKKQSTAESKEVAATASSDIRCACCDKIFEVSCDFYEHMSMRHPKTKRFITCKRCEHKFSHEEDFFLHIQFKHPDLVADMKSKSDKISSPTDAAVISTSSRKTDTSKQRVSSTRSTRKNISEPLENPPISKIVSVQISHTEKKRAESAFKKIASKELQMVNASSTSRTTRRSTARIRTPEPEPIEDTNFDNDSDHHFDDSGAMDVEEEEEECGIAITSTFSQKVPSPQKKQNNASGSFELDPMHCSTCSEVFYSYEALRKHELYFHNVKTTKMCPICGVYPTRLSRHLLAHENKTVRCSCVPCQISFPEFSQLLKHNLEMHPGVKGGALCAPNKPRDQIQADDSKAQQSSGTDSYRCKLCKKEFSEGSNARRHIRRTHSEQDADAETLIEIVRDGSEPDAQVDQEVEEILEDTSKKLLDPDWDDDDDVVEIEVPKAPSPQPIQSLKSSRPMPASARAKLNRQQDQFNQLSNKTNSNDSSDITVVQVHAPKKPGSRPMPASVRAKLEAQKKDVKESIPQDTTESKRVAEPKPTRPMPASIRAKLMSQASSASENSRDSSTSSNANKPRRPMPASVKAKLGLTKADDSIIRKSPQETLAYDDDNANSVPEIISTRGQRQTKPEVSDDDKEVVTLDDDDDDPMDNSFPEPDEEPPAPSVPTFSIADEIAEHNRAVQIAMGETNSTESNFYMFQCKLCNKKFDSHDGTRRHIQRSHSEYGPDHTENLIGRLFEDYAGTPRRRRSNVRYNEDYAEDDDDDDEVIIPRGTSRRPKPQATDADWMSPDMPASATTTSASDTPLVYACKWCGQTKDSAGNIKRHIRKAHPHLFNQRDQGVVIVGGAANEEFAEPAPPALPPQPKSASIKSGNPIYVCRICSRCMSLRSSLYMHILRSHSEVDKGKASSYIQELNGGGGGSSSSIPENEDTLPMEVDISSETTNPDNSFYCSICSYQTADEHDYVRHYKNHTGVSPYQCQYCSATFNRQQQLNAHITREHTGAEFLTADEAEISMEEVVGANQISVAATNKIHIESAQPLSSKRRYSSESNGKPAEVKKHKPGPASRKTAAARKSMPPPVAAVEADNSPPASPTEKSDEDFPSNGDTSTPLQQQKDLTPTLFPYQGDLSSLFPTLGGGAAPGGIDALDDIDGGMSLD